MKTGTYDRHSDIHEAGLQAWHIGENEWNIATESPTWTVARAKLNTTKKGSKITGELRFHTKTEVSVILRLGFDADFIFKDAFCEYAGPRTALRYLMKFITAGDIYIHARLDLEGEARKAGISEFRILEAYEWEGEDTDRRTCLNLYCLLQEHRERS